MTHLAAENRRERGWDGRKAGETEEQRVGGNLVSTFEMYTGNVGWVDETKGLVDYEGGN